jgi:Cys-tRNA(Pro)/Cys-tRNA(Cys) deacylase
MGVAYVLHEYAHDPTVTSYGDEAVAALGVAGERVLKTLVADAADRLVVAVVPVPAHLALKAIAAAFGAKRAAMADPRAAERSSGYLVGAISPIGHKRRLATVIDDSALAFETVFCSGGRRGLELELAPADLVLATDARTAPIARR